MASIGLLMLATALLVMLGMFLTLVAKKQLGAFMAYVRAQTEALAAFLGHRDASVLRSDMTANAALLGGLTIAFTVIGAIIALIIVAKLAPTYISSVGNVTQAITTTDFHDSTVNSLRGVFGTLVAIGGLVAVVLLSLGVMALRKSGAI